MTTNPKVKNEFSPRGSILLVVISAVSVMAILRFFKAPANTLIWHSAMNAGHVALFGVFSLASLRCARALAKGRGVHPLLPFALAFLITVGFSVLTEFLQYFSPRDADLGDFLRNLCGGMAALLLVLAFDREALRFQARGRPLVRTMLVVVSMGLLVVSFMSVAVLTRAYLERSRAFPRICGFQSSWEKSFYGVRDAKLAVTKWPKGINADPEDLAGYITFLRSTYPGFKVKEMVPDWRDYDRLCFTVYSELRSPIELVLRLDDVHHDDQLADRFSRSLTIKPGINEIVVPLAEVKAGPEDREMDMERIRSLVLFAIRPTRTFSLYIDSFRLEGR